MADRIIKAGSTDVSIMARLFFDGSGKPADNNTIANIDMQIYRLDNDNDVHQVQGWTALTALANLEAAHADNYGYNMVSGFIRVDLPDTACQAAAVETIVLLRNPTVTEKCLETVYRIQIAPVPADVTLIEGTDATDQIRDSIVDDATRIDVSALNTHAAITAAGIVNEWETQSQADPTGFHVNVMKVNGSSQTANDNGADLNTLIIEVGVKGAGLTNIPWNASWDTEVQSECTDALTAYDPPTKTEMDSGHALLSLASVCTEARLATLTDWINGGRLDLLLDAIKSVTDVLPNAGALTDIDTGVNNLETAVITNAAGVDISADILVIDNFVDDLESRLTAARAGYLDELAAANIPADIDALTASLSTGNSFARSSDSTVYSGSDREYAEGEVNRDSKPTINNPSVTRDSSPTSTATPAAEGTQPVKPTVDRESNPTIN